MPDESRVIWSGMVPSASGRRSKRTGQPLEYRVILFEDDTALCSCPASLFYATRTGDDTPGARERYRCAHITSARQAQGKETTPPAVTPTAIPDPRKGVPATETPDDFLAEFQDDVFSDLPQVRRERTER